jgi:hypothetical protein
MSVLSNLRCQAPYCSPTFIDTSAARAISSSPRTLSSADALDYLAGSVALGAGRRVPATGTGTVWANILSGTGRARRRLVAGIHRRVRQFLTGGVPIIDRHLRAPPRPTLLDVVNACRRWSSPFLIASCRRSISRNRSAHSMTRLRPGLDVQNLRTRHLRARQHGHRRLGLPIQPATGDLRPAYPGRKDSYAATARGQIKVRLEGAMSRR